MDHHILSTKNFTLKVGINHCNDCLERAMKKLKRIDGIDSARYDTAKELLRVSGNIDPAMLIQKFDKWGRRAELYSFEKGSMHIDEGRCKSCGSSKEKTHGVKIKDFGSSSDSNDDGDDEESYDVHAPKKGSNNISWQHPSLMQSSPKETPMNKQSAKKSKKLFGGGFGKKDKAAKASGNKNVSAKSPAASKWHFPRPSMPAYVVPGPFGNQRLYHMNQYPPMMFPRPMRPYYGYGPMPLSMVQPPPLPYGFYQPRPPPRMNPMIHYTSYKDNYYP